MASRLKRGWLPYCITWTSGKPQGASQEPTDDSPVVAPMAGAPRALESLADGHHRLTQLWAPGTATVKRV